MVQTECSLIVQMTAWEKLGNILFDRKILPIISTELESDFLCEYADMQVLQDIRDMILFE